jgi:dTDP-4-dehydrorhamnose 3,5-epimerase-like enzyme
MENFQKLTVRLNLNKEYKMIKKFLLTDDQSELVVFNNFKELPFLPNRFFHITNHSANLTRGGHAHKTCEQILFVISGKVLVKVNDGKNSEEIMLESRSEAIYLPKLVWSDQIYLDPKSILGVMASEVYDESEYIRAFDNFLELKDKAND